ncbi:MAG: tRNA uridine-5-carboxymethylaminomethyl(34) synthesis GTPase MnmE [Pseudomonadales bacterium]|nr:tRNA uridine-5-carboxymethylaminomethyl(34) synthesis GTPase MnmE [Pseudomonadales bacterium]
MTTLDTDTIVAVATPPGQGGIGVVRLSGPQSSDISGVLCSVLGGKPATPRLAQRVSLHYDGEAIDDGLLLYFPGPNSFTGEDVVEFQLHGSPITLQRTLDACRASGARLARPGEFSERAFLNNKIDLVQAEAIADLIASASQGAARAAVRALSGEFSNHVGSLVAKTERMRILVEATIDFPEEEEDFLARYSIPQQLASLQVELAELLAKSGRGKTINEGIAVALIGAPNAGKSSLLNRLAGEDAAIVTDIPGTTRDLLKVDLVLNDLPVRLVDTAGLRETEDPVEREGVSRARTEARRADVIVCLVDATAQNWARAYERLLEMAGLAESVESPVLVPVINKCDLISQPVESDFLPISAKTGTGVELLIETVRRCVGLTSESTDFTARQRHIDALKVASEHLDTAVETVPNAQLELLAEELRETHNALGEIVGKTTPDELLGKIFSEFCIGK